MYCLLYIPRRYTENQFDSAFIDVLREAVVGFVTRKGDTTLREVADFIAAKKFAKVRVLVMFVCVLEHDSQNSCRYVACWRAKRWYLETCGLEEGCCSWEGGAAHASTNIHAPNKCMLLLWSQVDLRDEDIHSIIQTLIYDGRVDVVSACLSVIV